MDEMNKLGPLSGNLYEAINKIIAEAVDAAMAAVVADPEIPEGFVKIPTDGEKTVRENRYNNINGKVKMAVSAALPAGLVALASVFNAPTAVAVVLSGAGGAAGSFIQNTAHGGNTTLDELNMQELHLPNLTKKDIKVNCTSDKQKVADLMSEANESVMQLCAELSTYENEMNEKHDIAVDKGFGEWVQQFLMFAAKNSDDRKIQRLRDDLVNRLSNMNIHIYDDILLRENGELDLPIQDYVFDSRETLNDSYQQVVRPAVYSNCALLAKGEVR